MKIPLLTVSTGADEWIRSVTLRSEPLVAEVTRQQPPDPVSRRRTACGTLQRLNYGRLHRPYRSVISATVINVLVVDDEADSRDVLSRMLRLRGHRATPVPNGREALAVLTSATPDLIVLDLRMPQMDGIMFLEVVRSYLRLQHIPVLIMTAYPESPDLSRARSLGVRGIFAKGEGDFEKLLDAVEREAGTLPGGPDTSSDDPPRIG